MFWDDIARWPSDGCLRVAVWELELGSELGASRTKHIVSALMVMKQLKALNLSGEAMLQTWQYAILNLDYLSKDDCACWLQQISSESKALRTFYRR